MISAKLKARCPCTDWIISTTAEGIQALITNPGKSTWTGYLEKTPEDPWKNEYQYANPGTHNPDKFDLWTLGSDGAPGGEGAAADIGNWDVK